MTSRSTHRDMIELISAESQPRRHWSIAMVLLALHVPLAWGLIAIALLEKQTGVTLASLIRDPVQVLHAPVYIGMLSNFGALCWCASAVVCLFAAALVRGIDPASFRFLLFSGLFNLLLTCDDLFLLHDGALARWVQIGDKKTDRALWADRGSLHVLLPQASDG